MSLACFRPDEGGQGSPRGGREAPGDGTFEVQGSVGRGVWAGGAAGEKTQLTISLCQEGDKGCCDVGGGTVTVGSRVGPACAGLCPQTRGRWRFYSWVET